MKWGNQAPTVADLNGQSEEYYWVQGGNFNRPLMVRVNNGVSSKVIDGKRKFFAAVNFQFCCENVPLHIWEHDMDMWPGLKGLQWAGPVPRVRESVEDVPGLLPEQDCGIRYVD